MSRNDHITGRAAALRDKLIEMNREYVALTGTEYYLYASRPGDGQTRVVFVDGVEHGWAAGVEHMTLALTAARGKAQN